LSINKKQRLWGEKA